MGTSRSSTCSRSAEEPCSRSTFLAKTRMKMLTTVTAMKALPHTQFDNQQTSFDSVRLKKGAPLGQMTRNFYTQQLGILKNSKNFVKNTQAQHLDEVMCGVYRRRQRLWRTS